jgi:type IV secretory pathway component VirB8
LTIAADRSADDAARTSRARHFARRRSLGNPRARTSRPRIAARVVIVDGVVIVVACIIVVVVVVVVVPVRAFRSEDANE